MKVEPKWIKAREILAIHKETIAEFGGADGTRSENLLMSALARPKDKFAYDESVTLFDLASAYCFGIVKNHPFYDGNKRTGFQMIDLFLFKNSYLFEPDEADAVRTILDLASSKMSEQELSQWILDNSKIDNSRA
ncbi:MAG: type II toxin-antitoxin system death-on-curing family toxin [Nitrospinae bacterium]|nr:type II toxin-antitoxin system death-on-curing family toxin [Nitrospinota bacterium]